MYSGNGYIVDLPRSQMNATKFIHDLKLHSWLGDQSRVVFVEVVLLFPTLNAIVPTTFMVEVPYSHGFLFVLLTTWDELGWKRYDNKIF